MRCIPFFTLILSIFSCNAQTLPSDMSTDPQAKIVENFVNQQTIVTDTGNPQKPAQQFKSPTTDSNALSSVNRLFLQFQQDQQRMNAVDERMSNK